jgi:stage III sporulation protein AG
MNGLKELFKKKDGPPKKGVSFQYVAVILGLGIALMLFGSFFSSGSSDKQKSVTASNQTKETQSVAGQNDSSSPSSVIEYEHYYEDQLKEALEDVYGVSDPKVKVYIATTETKIVGKDKKIDSKTTTETDKQGGSRKIEERDEDGKAITTNGDNGEQPLIIGKEQPQISGVLVVAGGADNAQVQLWIKEAVNSLFGVPDYRITVLPKKQRGNH